MTCTRVYIWYRRLWSRSSYNTRRLAVRKVTVESQDGLTLTSTIKEGNENLLVKEMTIRGVAGDGHWYVDLVELVKAPEGSAQKDTERKRTIKCVMDGGFKLELQRLPDTRQG
jgi:predicted neuraminidase